MGAALVPVLLVLVVLVVGSLALTGAARRQRARVEETHRPDVATLRYEVPAGQDPVALVTALHSEGFDAVAEGEQVVVSCGTDADADRERVRAAIAASPLNVEGDTAPRPEVRFTDE